MTVQTARDIAQVVDIPDTWQHELGEMADTCLHVLKALVALKVAAQGALEALRGKT